MSGYIRRGFGIVLAVAGVLALLASLFSLGDSLYYEDFVVSSFVSILGFGVGGYVMFSFGRLLSRKYI